MNFVILNDKYKFYKLQDIKEKYYNFKIQVYLIYKIILLFMTIFNCKIKVHKNRTFLKLRSPILNQLTKYSIFKILGTIKSSLVILIITSVLGYLLPVIPIISIL